MLNKKINDNAHIHRPWLYSILLIIPFFFIHSRYPAMKGFWTHRAIWTIYRVRTICRSQCDIIRTDFLAVASKTITQRTALYFISYQFFKNHLHIWLINASNNFQTLFFPLIDIFTSPVKDGVTNLQCIQNYILTCY